MDTPRHVSERCHESPEGGRGGAAADCCRRGGLWLECQKANDDGTATIRCGGRDRISDRRGGRGVACNHPVALAMLLIVSVTVMVCLLTAPSHDEKGFLFNRLWTRRSTRRTTTTLLIVVNGPPIGQGDSSSLPHVATVATTRHHGSTDLHRIGHGAGAGVPPPTSSSSVVNDRGVFSPMHSSSPSLLFCSRNETTTTLASGLRTGDCTHDDVRFLARARWIKSSTAEEARQRRNIRDSPLVVHLVSNALPIADVAPSPNPREPQSLVLYSRRLIRAARHRSLTGGDASPSWFGDSIWRSQLRRQLHFPFDSPRGGVRNVNDTSASENGTEQLLISPFAVSVFATLRTTSPRRRSNDLHDDDDATGNGGRENAFGDGASLRSDSAAPIASRTPLEHDHSVVEGSGRRQEEEASDVSSLAVCFFGAFQRQKWRTVWDINRVSLRRSSFGRRQRRTRWKRVPRPPPPPSLSPLLPPRRRGDDDDDDGRDRDYDVFASTWDYEIDPGSRAVSGAEKFNREETKRFFRGGRACSHVGRLLRDEVFTIAERRKGINVSALAAAGDAELNRPQAMMMSSSEQEAVVAFPHPRFRGSWVQRHEGFAARGCKSMTCVVGLVRAGCLHAVYNAGMMSRASRSSSVSGERKRRVSEAARVDGLSHVLGYDFLFVTRADSVLSIPLAVYLQPQTVASSSWSPSVAFGTSVLSAAGTDLKEEDDDDDDGNHRSLPGRGGNRTTTTTTGWQLSEDPAAAVGHQSGFRLFLQVGSCPSFYDQRWFPPRVPLTLRTVVVNSAVSRVSRRRSANVGANATTIDAIMHSLDSMPQRRRLFGGSKGQTDTSSADRQAEFERLDLELEDAVDTQWLHVKWLSDYAAFGSPWAVVKLLCRAVALSSVGTSATSGGRNPPPEEMMAAAAAHEHLRATIVNFGLVKLEQIAAWVPRKKQTAEETGGPFGPPGAVSVGTNATRAEDQAASPHPQYVWRNVPRYHCPTTPNVGGVDDSSATANVPPTTQRQPSHIARSDATLSADDSEETIGTSADSAPLVTFETLFALAPMTMHGVGQEEEEEEGRRRSPIWLHRSAPAGSIAARRQSPSSIVQLRPTSHPCDMFTPAFLTQQCEESWMARVTSANWGKWTSKKLQEGC